jgi:type IV pilus assembly protein PilB
VDFTVNEQSEDFKKQWLKVFRALFEKIGKEKISLAHEKKQALNAKHLFEVLDHLGYMKYSDARDLVFNLFRDELPLLESTRASQIRFINDSQEKYFLCDNQITHPCFIPVNDASIHQSLLSYDDFNFIISQYTNEDTRERKNVFTNFTFENVVNDAVLQGASDIHIAPKEDFYRIFFRLSGDLVEQEKYMLDIDKGSDFVYSIKLEASRSSKGAFNLDKNTAPQDGRVVYDGVDARLIFIPDGVLGKRTTVTARVIVKVTVDKPDLSKKGFGANIRKSIIDTTKRSGGLVLISGITGSGKSMLTAEILAGIEKSRRIYTIEDPIEYVLSGKNITQHQLYLPPSGEDAMGYSEFTKALKRADADIVSIGEMRNDSSLVQAIFEMANAGQLIFTTVHIRSAFEIYHALDHVFKLDFKSVVPIVFLSINAKLSKKLCENCKVVDHNNINADRLQKILPKLPYERKIVAEEFIKQSKTIKTFLRGGEELKNGFPMLDHDGKTIPCSKCNGSGYSGRTPLYEFFEPDVEMIEYILKYQPTRFQIEDRACQKKLGQNRLETFIEKMVAGLIDTSPEIIKTIL